MRKNLRSARRNKTLVVQAFVPVWISKRNCHSFQGPDISALDLRRFALRSLISIRPAKPVNVNAKLAGSGTPDVKTPLTPKSRLQPLIPTHQLPLDTGPNTCTPCEDILISVYAGSVAGREPEKSETWSGPDPIPLHTKVTRFEVYEKLTKLVISNGLPRV